MDSSELTHRQRRAVAITTVAIALTRLAAIARTAWDWDEALFALAVRDFDVSLHHPHPPGFPLFVALAKLLPLDEFRAPQTIAVLASLFVFPAMFWLARELRLRFAPAIASAVLLALFPNVWLFGGTAFSDVPSLVLSLCACALLLRGRRSDRALLAGCVVLAIAAGVRPQNLLIGFVPAILALRARPRVALLGAAAGVAILVTSYGLAARESGGWDAYRDVLARHERYIRETDSFLSEARPWLPQVADDFFIRPFRAPALNVVIAILMGIGLLRRERPVLLALAIFGPFLFFAWLFLDFHSVSRFSIAYMPLFAILAGCGLPRRAWIVTLAAVACFITVWMLPVLAVVRTTMSPPVAAMTSIRALPRTTIVYVDGGLTRHAEWMLADYDRRPLSEARGGPPGVLLLERESRAPGARNFLRSRERLVGVARIRYFEVSVVPKP
jgi:hypothetical protein